jgi:hypothetical protein
MIAGAISFTQRVLTGRERDELPVVPVRADGQNDSSPPFFLFVIHGT